MSISVKPIPVLMVRDIADLCPQHYLPVPIRHPLTLKIRRHLPLGMAGAVGNARPAVQLSVLEHDVCECGGRGAGDVAELVLDLRRGEIREMGWKEVEREKAGLVEAEQQLGADVEGEEAAEEGCLYGYGTGYTGTKGY